MMIAVQYDQTDFLESPMVNITFTQSHYHKYANGTTAKNKTNIYLEPCTLDHFINLPNYDFNWTESYTQEGISDFLCLPIDKTFPVGGVFESDDYYFIKFTVTKCVNATANPDNPWNPVCASQEDIDANDSQSSRIRFYLSSNILHPEKATGSITSYLDSQIFNVQQSSVKMYTTANIYLNLQSLTTDESILPLVSDHTEELIQYKRSDTWQQNAVGNFANFCEIFFLRSNYSTFAKKSYLKIDAVISYIGGFCQIFFLISAFLELANRLYDFEINHNNPQKDQLSKTGQNSLSEKYIISQGQLKKSSSPNKFTTNQQISEIGISPETSKKKLDSQNSKNSDKNKNLSFKSIFGIGSHSSQKKDKINNKIQISDEVKPYPLNSFNKNISPKNQYTNTYVQSQNSKNNGGFEEKQDVQISLPIESKNQQIQLKDDQENLHMNQSVEIDLNCDWRSQQYKLDQQKSTRSNIGLASDRNMLESQERQKVESYGYSKENSLKRATTKIADNNPSLFLEKELKPIISRDRSLKINYQYFINSMSFGKYYNTPEIQLLNKALNYINEDLDIFTILERQKEQEKMQKLFLNEDQKVLFNFFPKPIIKTIQEKGVLDKKLLQNELKEMTKSMSTISKSKGKLNFPIKNMGTISKAIVKFKKGKQSNISNYQKLYDHYQKLSNQSSQDNYQTQINQKLIELLGDEMRTIFEVADKMASKENNKNLTFSTDKLLKKQTSQYLHNKPESIFKQQVKEQLPDIEIQPISPNLSEKAEENEALEQQIENQAIQDHDENNNEAKHTIITFSDNDIELESHPSKTEREQPKDDQNASNSEKQIE